MASKPFLKTPAEFESYGISYRHRLTNKIFINDTIATSTWVVEAGITKVADAIDENNTRTTIKLSGGSNGTTYTLTNMVVTVGGRTLEETIKILVRAG